MDPNTPAPAAPTTPDAVQPPSEAGEPQPQLQSVVEHVTWVHGTHSGVLALAGDRLSFTTKKKGRQLDVALADVRLTWPKISMGTEMDVHVGKDTWKFSFANTTSAGMIGVGSAMGGVAGGAIAGLSAVSSVAHLVGGHHHLKVWREALTALQVQEA
jgi:hypothetical protein